MIMFMKKMKKVRVLLAIPVHSYMTNETIKSLFEMEIPKNVELEFNYCEGYTVGLARTGISNYALDKKFDYILWVDADVVVPKDLLVKLLNIMKSKKDCGLATGYYVKKVPGEPIAELFFKKPDNTMQNTYEKDLPKNQIVKIDACGMGCCLTSCSDMKNLKDKYGMLFEYTLNKDSILSEDLNYCIKLQNEGKKLYADTSLRCVHVGKGLF